MENQEHRPEFAEVVDIQFRPGQKIYYFDPAGIACKAGDAVIIDTARGPEFGTCTGGNHKISVSDVVAPLRPVIRIATEQDKKFAEENHKKEKHAFEVCTQQILDFSLDMQLVSAELSFDGTKLLFFFTADERVDFRELVKSLANTFHTRIELRQIGVRDKAKMVGGLGICGRPFCCATFLDDFQPVSIKMAKTQNLSLNPTKISGTCGRLMCCLKYEQDAYEDLLRTSPNMESLVDTPDGRGTVVEVDLLRQRVKVRMEDGENTGVYRNEDIAVLRSGKAKKNDPPIPDDLAPISGAGKRKKKEQEEQSGPRFLDPIRFRYSEETIAEEQPIEEPQEQTKEQPSRNRNRNRRKGKARPENKEQAPKMQEKAPVEKTPAPKNEGPEKQQPQNQGQNQHRRRRPQYRRRPQKPGENAPKAE